MEVPGVPLPGAKSAPPPIVRLPTDPAPVNVPPAILAPPFSAPALFVVPAVLVNSPDTVAPALLVKVPAFDTVPVTVPALSNVALFVTFEVMLPVAETTSVPAETMVGPV